MSSHDLARQLLAQPDLPVVTGLNRSGYGEPVVDIEVLKAHAYDSAKNQEEDVIELVVADESSHVFPSLCDE